MLRARPLAGDMALGALVLEDIRPFVYRRYLDFGALESLRSLKALIRQEVAKKGLENDIKRGAGGIREAEFVIQVQQLIHGGRLPALRTQSWLQAATALQQCLDISTDVLVEDYRFLRHLEHAIMCDQLGQTHQLPIDESAQARLLAAMRVEDWDQLALQISQVRGRVQQAFEAVVEPEQQEVAQPDQPLPEPL